MKKTTTTGGRELKRAGKEILGDKFQGVFASDDKRPPHKRAFVISSIPNRVVQAGNIGSRADQTAQCTTVSGGNDTVTCRATPNNSPTRRIVGSGRLPGCARVMTLV